MVERGGLENRCTARYRGFKSLSLRFFWKRGRAVIRRIANPWVPIWARQVRLLSLPFYKLLLERDCSSAGLERHPAEVEVARSNRVSLKRKRLVHAASFFVLKNKRANRRQDQKARTLYSSEYFSKRFLMYKEICSAVLVSPSEKSRFRSSSILLIL